MKKLIFLFYYLGAGQQWETMYTDEQGSYYYQAVRMHRPILTTKENAEAQAWFQENRTI